MAPAKSPSGAEEDWWTCGASICCHRVLYSVLGSKRADGAESESAPELMEGLTDRKEIWGGEADTGRVWCLGGNKLLSNRNDSA